MTYVRVYEHTEACRGRAPALLVIAACLLLGACNPQEMALVGSEDTGEVAAFEPGTGTIKGNVTIPNVNRGASEILLRRDGQMGYVRGEVAQGQTTIHVIDIGSPPTLEGTPTTVSYIVSDIAEVNALTIVGAGRDALGSGDILVSSAVPAAQSEEDVLNLGPGSDATVDVCDDESTVLVATNGTGSQRAVRKLKIDDQQRLTDTGDSFQPSAPPQNVHCAPGSQAGIVVNALAEAQTFTTANMNVVDTQNLAAHGGGTSSFGHSADFTSSGNAVFVVSSVGDFTGRGHVERFSFNASTGALGSATQATIEPVTRTTVGLELVGVGPNDNTVYVTEWGSDRVLALDATTLSQQNTISGSALTSPLSINVVGQ
jgi:YVTN family beta-propeller protein